MNMKALSVLAGLVLVSLFSGSCRQQATQKQVKETRLKDAVVASADGVQIRYHYNIKDSNASPAVVFVHGWCCDSSYWKNQVPYFVDKYSIVTIDLAGHGESGLNRQDWSPDNFAADVAAVVRTLDLRHVVLVGHSMGGPVIVRAAELLPERVIALVPVDTLSDVEEEYSKEAFDKFLEPMAANFPETTKQFVTKGLFHADADPALVQQVADDMAQGPSEIGIEMMKGMFDYDVKPILDNLNIPVRSINGDLYPVNEAANRRHIKDYQLIIMKNVGHFPMLEVPDQFNRVLDSVIAALLQARNQDNQAQDKPSPSAT